MEKKKGLENHPTHKQRRKSSDLTSNPKLFSTREVLDVFRRLVLHDEGREPRLDQLIARVLGNIWRDTDPERKIFFKKAGRLTRGNEEARRRVFLPVRRSSSPALPSPASKATLRVMLTPQPSRTSCPSDLVKQRARRGFEYVVSD